MMEFEGRVWKSRTSRYWVVYIETLDFGTQGTSKADALEMIKDAVESVVHKPGFRATVSPGVGGAFTVGANNPAAWMGFILQQLRMKERLTVQEVARRMGFTSKTAYARYEQGKVTPSVLKFIQILHAICPKRRPVLRLAA